MRIGIHSGPVTAGVLRGDRARFQLFGDTVNTAAVSLLLYLKSEYAPTLILSHISSSSICLQRMESNGEKNKIQVSQDTADLLVSHGKESWVIKREDLVEAKGKGAMQTYWIRVQSAGSKSTASTELSETSDRDLTEFEVGDDTNAQKHSSLIKWNVEMLTRLVRQIMATNLTEMSNEGEESALDSFTPSGVPLDELVEVMEFPKSDAVSLPGKKLPKLNSHVKRELHSLVSNIATLYKDNHFHGFEHASHVTMSVVKLLSRVVAPSANDARVDGKAVNATESSTASGMLDPLTQFACVFSALIHDVDHSGASNAQLVTEGASIASYYRERSVAEQNSVDLSWQLFMQNDFKRLRKTVCPTEKDLHRLRQLVVNIVLATDIMDKELKQLRNARWEKAFSPSTDTDSESLELQQDRKATIVIEHLIQASDVAHTMQHWHVYRKWNEKLFMEMTHAYQNGRLGKAPEDFWYEGEIGFFDYYIIPLAKKLKDCGVFGVSSEEYLNYAEKNRQEWVAKGQAVVAELREKAASNFKTKHRLQRIMEKSRSKTSTEIEDLL